MAVLRASLHADTLHWLALSWLSVMDRSHGHASHAALGCPTAVSVILAWLILEDSVRVVESLV